jgi:hypothetical protein
MLAGSFVGSFVACSQWRWTGQPVKRNLIDYANRSTTMTMEPLSDLFTRIQYALAGSSMTTLVRILFTE